MKVVSIKDALMGVVDQKVKVYVSQARKAGKKRIKNENKHGLTIDEAGAIWLYTVESAFYTTLNKFMRTADRNSVKPFFPYLKLLLNALGKLPIPKEKLVVWRGIKIAQNKFQTFLKNLRELQTDDEDLIWWSPTSCTLEMKTAQNFLKKGNGVKVLFNVESRTGVYVQQFSAIPSEQEVLLRPGTAFEVKNICEMASNLWIVQIQEKKLDYALVS